ncbi:MAG: YfhO family protein [Anaerolineae bacterium]
MAQVSDSDRSSDMVRVVRWIPIVILIILCSLFFHKLAFTDMILARGDTFTYFYPYWEARDSALRAGQLPLWTPDIFMGVPLLANPQLGTFYPPNWLTMALPVPDAIRISSVLHLIWASVGAFMLFRVAVDDRWMPALVAGMIFGLGGYVGAHVEQINQLQGIAWLPWLLYLFHQAQHSPRRRIWLLLMAMAWSLQIFSGHTQTVFMSGISLGIYALFMDHDTGDRLKRIGTRLLMLGLIALMAVALALPQLLPTLELTGMSGRGSGFDSNEATAFSLPPHYLGRALLPAYDGQLFTEYIAYIGVIGLGLALYGVLVSTRIGGQRRAWIALAVIGLGFALGRYTVLYLYIAELPGFNLFRVPARWLALYTLGMAMLAGRGLITLNDLSTRRQPALIAIITLVALMLVGRFAPIMATDIIGGAQPILTTLALWGAALLIVSVLFIGHNQKWTMQAGVIVIGVELFLAGRVLPVHDLVPRDVYLGQRFTISQMRAINADEIAPARMLAISARLFDVGDVTRLQARYQRAGLDTIAQQTALTAVKSQEILFPNLGLSWQIPTIDGYGGGLLPTIYYTQYSALLLPENRLRTVDGRIGEMLSDPACRGACIPDPLWLAQTHTDYLIIDKNFDVSHEGIFYDTALSDYWSAAPERPDWAFDTVSLLLSAEHAGLTSEAFTFRDRIYYRANLDWETFTRLLIDDDLAVLGASVVNTRTNTFQQLTPAGFERILSSDIKIYRLTPSSRVNLAQSVAITADNWQGHEDALSILRADPQTLVVHDAPQRDGTTTGTASIEAYSATAMQVTVDSPIDTYLYIADAHYPGWQATVNGEPVAIYRANVMFRAVPVPSGTSDVILRFVPRLWYGALAIGGGMWLVATVLLFWSILRKEY